MNKNELFSKRVARGIRKNYELFLLTIPAIVLVFLFHYLPMYGIQIAFKDFVPVSGIAGSQWVGLKHFVRFFSLYNCWDIIRNTFIISFYTLAINFPAPILLALLINQIGSNRFKRTLQTVTYMPHFISTVVIVGMLSIFLSVDIGFYGQLAKLFNFEATNILGEVGKFRSIYVLSDMWQHAGFPV